jgi:hypothetical protein
MAQMWMLLQKEEPKKVESEESIKINFAVLDKYPQPVSATVEQSLSSSQQIMAMALHSQHIESICNYSIHNALSFQSIVMPIINANAIMVLIILQEQQYLF